MRADLLLVEGDPTVDVADTRRIVQVWKAGRVAPDPRSKASDGSFQRGLISDFEVDQTARTGAGWAASTDGIAGGDSTASLERVDGGARGSKGALSVSGEVRDRFAYPWSGAMYHPGPAAMVPVDLSSSKALSFQARGDGGTYRVMLLGAGGGIPSTLTFEAPEEWTAVSLVLADFPGADLSEVAGVVFAAGPSTGSFSLMLDDIAIE